MTQHTHHAASPLEDIVNRYFELIRELRAGDADAVPKLMELWDPDGSFEFAGSPPVVGTYHGAAAITTLYKNRAHSGGMKMKAETKGPAVTDVTLGVVETDVSHIKVNGKRVVAAWKTTVGTQEGHGFDVAGSHLFTFDGDKIKTLRITVSPKPDPSHMKSLKLDALSVNDVGRLSLAAWAVV